MNERAKKTAVDAAQGDGGAVALRTARTPSSLVTSGLPAIILGVLIVLLPLVIPSFIESLVTKMMIYALFGVSMNILWGFAGVPTFGHAAYFGCGGYAAGVLIVHAGISNFFLNLLLAVLFSIAVAAFLGIPAFRVFGVGAADNPIYFLLATLAFGELLSRVAIALRPVTGGSTGLSGIPYPDLGFGKVNPHWYYYVVFVVVVICLYLIYRLVNSHYGYALRGIHDNERRMQALGYNTWLYKYTAYIFAGLFGGVSGVLFAYFGGVMVPQNFGMVTTDIVFLIVILGGASTYIGPILGSVLFVGIEYIASLYVPDRWPLILGAIFVFAIMAIPQGVGVEVLKVWRRITHGAS